MSEQSPQAQPQPKFFPGPPALVYKTRADYSDKVAVILNEARTAVVSYPHPKDLVRAGGVPKPTQLNKGFLLDNQGISDRVAFTRYTLEEYAALPVAPSPQQLFENLLDKEPLLLLCNCGNRSQYQQPEAALNYYISQELKDCRTLVDNTR